MAESTSGGCGGIEKILNKATHQWLAPEEVDLLIQNFEKLTISDQRPVKPESGSIFFYVKKKKLHYLQDGYKWKKTDAGRSGKFSNEKLKIAGKEELRCYYAHGEEDEKFTRRWYSLIEKPGPPNLPDIIDRSKRVVVHYLYDETYIPKRQKGSKNRSEVVPELDKDLKVKRSRTSESCSTEIVELTEDAEELHELVESQEATDMEELKGVARAPASPSVALPQQPIPSVDQESLQASEDTGVTLPGTLPRLLQQINEPEQGELLDDWDPCVFLDLEGYGGGEGGGGYGGGGGGGGYGGGGGGGGYGGGGGGRRNEGGEFLRTSKQRCQGFVNRRVFSSRPLMYMAHVLGM